jgi:hypothetical protein
MGLQLLLTNTPQLPLDALHPIPVTQTLFRHSQLPLLPLFDPNVLALVHEFSPERGLDAPIDTILRRSYPALVAHLELTRDIVREQRGVGAGLVLHLSQQLKRGDLTPFKLLLAHSHHRGMLASLLFFGCTFFEYILRLVRDEVVVQILLLFKPFRDQLVSNPFSTYYEYNVLQFAVRYSAPSLVHYLLTLPQLTPYMTVRTPRAETLFHYAIKSTFPERAQVVQLLKEHPVTRLDVNRRIRGCDGTAPIDFARKRRRGSIVIALQDRQDQPGFSRTTPRLRGASKRIRTLVRRLYRTTHRAGTFDPIEAFDALGSLGSLGAFPPCIEPSQNPT